MLGCDGLFYFPTQRRYADPRELGLRYESVSFPSPDGPPLHGWFFPAATAAAHGTVVHCHGNAGNISGHFEHVYWLPARGWNLLCFDYRGYGESPGRPSRRGTIDDAHAAVDFALRRGAGRGERVVLFGQSIGGSVAIVVAAERHDLAGVAVEGAFPSYRQIASYHIRRNLLLHVLGWWVPYLLMSDDWNPIDYVARVAPTPLLIVQGREDDIMDWPMARRLHERAGPRAWLMLVEGAGHTEAFGDDSPQRRDVLCEYFSLCVSGEEADGPFEDLLRPAGAASSPAERPP